MAERRASLRFGSLPIFWQTLVLLLAGLVMAQIVSILLVIYLPAPRPDFYTMTEIAERLRLEPGSVHELTVRHVDSEPVAEGGMISDPAITERLAYQLGRPVDDVRLLFEADQSEVFPFTRQPGSSAVPIRHGQPYFFNTVEAAERDPAGGWRVLRTPPKAGITVWQQRTMIWFGLTALALLPFGWLFARRLTRPIRRFVGAVERLGHDRDAPPVPVEGPSELRLTAQALNEMHARLHAHLRERTAMIGAIAHDLRTPMARIAFRIEGAPDKIRVPVQADIEQMRQMVTATIGFLRGDAGTGERHPVDLAALARRLAGEASDTGSPVSIAMIERAVVSGDRSALERLIQNLIDNAVQYGGGAELIVERDIDRARLTVADRGPGIPEEELERMFEPFERRDPSRSRSTGGLGLGLAIARSIAQAHGGTIHAGNRDGGGLAVTVDLPAAA
ncbi:MAG: HAMP domain-containing sensor histidine kinase [Sphingomonas oligoaromativorans]|uniref:sensor histidine kinase n=1 Tax=Sphingomonas oligoaromativorans TaxID=575322 RepID=UPI00141F02F0|nr:HAMP domain-containing sensor histidine kinase [Sphingomonas oligoaromativorans]NIJ32971.1 signal transduction histidine kinase [Sphingomonas oligoaromativorans]